MKRYDKKEMIREQHPGRYASLGRKKKNRPFSHACRQVCDPVKKRLHLYEMQDCGRFLFSTERCNPDGLRNALYPWDETVPPESVFSHTATTDYAGNKVYEDGSLTKILNEEGYVEMNNGFSLFQPLFFYKDHQGSVRVVVNGEGSVVQENNYYPSGTSITDNIFVPSPNSSQFHPQLPVSIEIGQPYKFGGKELDKSFAWAQYDFGARIYDPVLMRFSTPDPLAEKYYSISPYAYCMNNPVRLVDPTGMWIEISCGGANYRYDNGQLYQYQTEGKNIGQWTAYSAEKGSFLAGINDALNTINKSATGSELIGFYANDDNNAYIQATSEGNSIDMDGSVNTIYLNQDFKGSDIPTEAGLQTSPFWLDAAHELAHRQDFILNGESAKAKWLTNPDTGKDIPITEQYATRVENQIRADSRMLLRTHYVGQGAGGWEPSRVLNATRTNGFGINYFTGGLYIPRIKTPPLLAVPKLIYPKH